MELTVLNVAYPLAPVGPDVCGGAEQILTTIDEALVRAGHRSIVVACEGSCVQGELVAAPALPETLDGTLEEAHRRQRVMIERVLSRRQVDVVHMHALGFHHELPAGNVPVVATLHLPASYYAPEVFHLSRPRTYLHCVSAAQQRTFPPHAISLPFIENGVAVDQLLPEARKRPYVLALGRICPEKGFELAIDAAALADVPLILAGKVFSYEAHVRYFRDVIAKRLSDRCRFVGPVGFQEKHRLLARARCLVVPSLVPETSSLVAMEALACGTPVVAFPSGALADIVEHGETGFLVHDVKEMADAIGKAATLDPERCRRAALERFSSERMTAAYLALYERLALTCRGGSGTGDVRAPSRIGGMSIDHESASRPGAAGAPGLPRGELALQEIWSEAALAELSPEWSELWTRVGLASPFRSPEWLIPWWRCLGGGNPWVLALRRNGRLVAVAPLFRYYPDGMTAPAHLALMGAGITDDLGLLAEADDNAAAGALVLEHLAASRAAFSRCVLEALSAGDPLAYVPSPAGLRSVMAPDDVCPETELPLSFSSFLGSVARSVRESLRGGPRGLQSIGSMRFELAHAGTLPEFLEAFFRLHQARWAGRGDAGVLADERIRSFHREAAPSLLARGWLRLHGLRLDGRLIAVVYALAGRESMYCYLSGFEPGLARHSPGLLTVAKVIEDAIGLGLRRVDWLRGAERHKYLWGAQDRCLLRRTLEPNPC